MADLIYYLTGIVLTLGVVALVVAIIAFLVKPALLNNHPRIKSPVSRSKIIGVGLASIMVTTIGFSSVMAATEPASIRQERAAREAATVRAGQQKQQAQKAAEEEAKHKEAEVNKPVVKTEVKTEAVAFESTEQPDASIAMGEKRLAVQGINGERTITYQVTYVKGTETARTEVKNEVTKAPVTHVTKVGTYVKPAPVAAPSTGSGYTNSQGNYVPSPGSSPAGASAQCADGTYSYSQSRRGTCSHHGGVARWL